MSLPKLSIGRPVAISMFFVGVVFLGVLSFLRLAIDLLPDISYPKLVVYTSYPEVAPAEVEHFITERVENVVSTVPGVERVESVTREGLSLVILRFAWGTDMDFAALNVREKVDGLRGQLPETSERPVVLRQDPRSEPVMALSISGNADLWALEELSESVFRRRLEQIDGVAQAAVTGGLDREIHVTVDPRRLESYGLTIGQLATALDNANASGGSGMVRRGQFRYFLRTLGELQTVDEIGDIVIAQQGSGANGDPDGRIVMRDVATVEDGFKERESSATFNGRQAIGLLIFKESGANTVRVAERVDEVLAQLRTEYPAIELETAMSQAGFVSGAIDNLVQNMILGAVLAFLVLFLFLRDFRYPVAIALAIPISVIATFALLHAANVSLNIMSLGGLALGVGMLVDNSIVVLENIFRHREKGASASVASVIGTEEVQRAITASTLTTVAVFGPIIYVQGVAGQLFGALSFAVAFSLLASLVVAVTLLPMMAARWRVGFTEEDGTVKAGGRIRRGFGRVFNPPLDAFDRWFARFTLRYEALLAASMRNRARVVAVAIGLLIVTVPFAMNLKRSVLPEVDQGEFRAHIELPRGTPLEVTEAAATTLDGLLRADDGVEAVFTRVGKQTAIAGIEEETSGLNTAILDVRLKKGVKTHTVLDRLRPKLTALPDESVTLETGQATALGKLLGGGESDLAVRVRGDDLDASLAYAERLTKRLATLPELTNVRVGTELGQPEYLVEMDRERVAAFGLEPTTVAATVENYMRGKVADKKFVSFDRKIDIVVRLPEADRRSLGTLETLRVNDVPLKELVRVRESVGPVEIQRVDQNRILPVYADVATRGLDEAVAAVRGVVAEMPPPRGLRVDIGGENEEMRKSFRDLAFAFSLALILVYMILAAQFESFVHPFTVLLSVPLSLVGAIFGLWLFGAGLNTVSLIGVVILVGIVGNDAVVKIDFINQMRQEGMTVAEAVREAGHARLRPILMTSITTMLAILPMMLGIGAGGALQAPLAVAVFWGLLTSTALTLIVIPVVYALIEDARAWIRVRAGAAKMPMTEPASPEPASGD